MNKLSVDCFRRPCRVLVRNKIRIFESERPSAAPYITQSDVRAPRWPNNNTVSPHINYLEIGDIVMCLWPAAISVFRLARFQPVPGLTEINLVRIDHRMDRQPSFKIQFVSGQALSAGILHSQAFSATRGPPPTNLYENASKASHCRRRHLVVAAAL